MRKALVREVLRVLRRWDTLTPAGGEPVRRLEEQFCRMFGFDHGLALASGTMALEVALRAAGIGLGDEVVVAAYDWGAAAGAVLRCGAVPVLADIDPVRATLDPGSLRAAVTGRTAAVVVTHLFGCPADMAGVLAVARRHGLLVVEDCCQALGARLGGRPVGTFGDAAAFSFGWGKIVCGGEGGMLVVRDEELWRRAIWVSQHPWRQVLETGTEGPLSDMALNGRIHPLAATLARAQLGDLPRVVARRRRACRYLSRHLRGLTGVLLPPEDPPDGRHAFHRYSPLVAEGIPAEAVVASLFTAGWPVHQGYVRPLYLRELFRERYRPDDFPGAERRWRQSLGIDADWPRVGPRWLNRLAGAFAEAMEAMGCRKEPLKPSNRPAP